MSCPTCDHTMQKISSGVFWCPRCGSLRFTQMQTTSTAVPSEHTPWLVPRVIEFAGKLTDEHQELIDAFEGLGIREAIMVDDVMF